jgi:hypothetical protein
MDLHHLLLAGLPAHSCADPYFRDCVIGGQGAFMVPARERSQFQLAIKAKILLEVSAASPDRDPLVRPAQGDAARRANCFAGEARWQNRFGN